MKMKKTIKIFKNNKYYSFESADIYNFLNGDDALESDLGYFGNTLDALIHNIITGDVRVLGQILDQDYSFTRFMARDKDENDDEFALFIPADKITVTRLKNDVEPAPKEA